MENHLDSSRLAARSKVLLWDLKIGTIVTVYSALACVFIPAPAACQVDASNANPPVIRAVDVNGVTLKTGQFTRTNVDMINGAPDDPSSVALIRTMRSSSPSNNMSDVTGITTGGFGFGSLMNWDNSGGYAHVLVSTFQLEVRVGERIFYFMEDGYGNYEDFFNTGAQFVSLSSGTWPPFKIVETDGTEYIFDILLGGTSYGRHYAMSAKVLPDGTKFNLTYSGNTTSVVNSRGRGIRLIYNSSIAITSATSFIRKCNPSCVDTDLDTVSYSYSNVTSPAWPGFNITGPVISSFTTVDNRVIYFSFDNYFNILSETDPSNSSRKLYENVYYRAYYWADNFQGVNATCGESAFYRVSSYKDANGSVTNYTYGTDPGYDDPYDSNGNMIGDYQIGESQPRGVCGATNLVTSADGVTTKYRVWNLRNLPSWIEDPLGRRTTYSYDTQDRLVSITYPNGVVKKFTPGWRRTFPEVRTVATPSSGLADVVLSTSYIEDPALPTCINPKVCSKPAAITDARGGVTTYTWSSVTGQQISTVQPADGTGASPTVTNSYSGFTGIDGATISLLTTKTEAISPGNTVQTSYEYDASDALNLKSMVVSSGGVSLRTCYRYDSRGNRISETKPRAGLAVCP